MNLFLVALFIFTNTLNLTVSMSTNERVQKLINLSKYKLMNRRIGYSENPAFRFRGVNLGKRKNFLTKIQTNRKIGKVVRRAAARRFSRNLRPFLLRKYSLFFCQ